MLNTEKEIIDYCSENNLHIYDIVLEEEMKTTGKSQEEIFNMLDRILIVMGNSAKDTLKKPIDTRFKMIDGFANRLHEYSKGESVVGSFLIDAMSYGLSTSECNAAMGKIAAAPTAGSSGIMPGVFMAIAKKYDLPKRTLYNGLLTSIGIGQIIGKYATFSGAEGGCQAECGSAAAMAAAAVVEMLGGSPREALNAASITLVNVMGLVCDPIAGLVEYPCAFRNASGVMNALICADMALAGIKSVVPFEEVTMAMKEVGELMDETLRETGLGGLAGTKTGKMIRKELLGEV